VLCRRSPGDGGSAILVLASRRPGW